MIGSTEESAVDPLRKIIDLREELRREGLDFAIHADAAWGGYFNCMYREEGLLFRDAAPEFPMSDYVGEQYRALREANSITVDPHKAGFVPYPAGGLCYRNSAMRDLVSLAAPVVFHNQTEPTVGVYGIEGSKPGAAAAGVYLAHKVIRPTKQGYGKILSQCVWTSKRMYCRLLTMDDRDPQQPSPFKTVLFQMLPAEVQGLGQNAVQRQRDMAASFVGLSNQQLLDRLGRDKEAEQLFKEIGSDQVILAYSVNFRDRQTGTWNTDPDKLNKLNNKIFDICSIVDLSEDPNSIDLILTNSSFDVSSYGEDFIAHYSRRLGLNNPANKSITFLISTTMNPWTTDTPVGDFLGVVEKALRKAAYEAADKIGLDIGPAAKAALPYGSWRSPITADLITREQTALSEVRLVDGDVYWLEGRPSEKSRSVVVRLTGGAGDPADMLPPYQEGRPYFDIRDRVYSYGGGAWVVDEGILYFSNSADGRLYRQDCGGSPVPLTPPPADPRKVLWHYGDGLIDRPRQRWIGVVEDRSGVNEASRHERERQPLHRIVAVNLADGRLDHGTPLVEGHDFFSSQRLSPDGQRLAWIAWDHPRMPWQDTTLYIADLGADGRPAGAPTAIAGGSDESVMQPQWSPEGESLWFISDRSGWWNLYRYDLATGKTDTIAPQEAEFGQPQWMLGQSSYAFIGGGRIAAAYTRQGLAKLAIIEPEGGGLRDLDLPYNTIISVQADGAGRVSFIGGAPQIALSVVLYDVAAGSHQVLRKANLLADDRKISRHFANARPITFPTTGNEVAHGLFYAPANADYTGPANEKPPLIVTCHGGPTSQASSGLSLGIQYWTSRGSAVLDVNYRGSSGYGRAYRDRLKESWGIVDVDDCISGARYLAEGNLVDGDRVVIRGGSAGGYTTLAALTFRDYFKAGASYYGIGDLEALALETHKFELHYLDWLVGPYPAQLDRYRERSPKYHVDCLSRPVIFFQGEKDAVVPPDQSQAMFEAIRNKGLPAGYYLFAGEEHGFRQAENNRRAIEAEHAFFTFQVFRTRLDFGEPAAAQPAPLPREGADSAEACENSTDMGMPAQTAREPYTADTTIIGGPTRQPRVTAQTYAFRSGARREHHSLDDHGHGHDGHSPQPEPGSASVENERHFHAFSLLGTERLFASHLTMLDDEVHMYQFIAEIGLPEPFRSRFISERRDHPLDSYFIANTLADPVVCNPVSDPMTIPELAGHLRTSFVGNIFRGIPYRNAYESWPWAGVKPVLGNIPVTVERIVHFRPFDATMTLPGTLVYLLFGAGGEGHMVHLQSREPDFDHCLTLQQAPPWLAQDLLRAGVVVDIPDLRPIGDGDRAPGVRCANPLQDRATVQVRYRSAGNPRPVTVSYSPWFCVRVANHPDPCQHCPHPCGTATPQEHLQG